MWARRGRRPRHRAFSIKGSFESCFASAGRASLLSREGGRRPGGGDLRRSSPAPAHLPLRGTFSLEGEGVSSRAFPGAFERLRPIALREKEAPAQARLTPRCGKEF